MKDKTDNHNYILLQEQRHNSGFTLMGIAIILVLVGLLVGAGARFMGSVVKRSKILETKKTVDAAVESLVIYGTSNNELPASASFAPILTTSEDVWKKPLYYIVDAGLLDSTVGGICDRTSTDLTLNICPDSVCSSPTNTISNVAFIVLSGGENFNNQTAGTEDISSVTEINVYAPDVDIDNYTADVNRPDAYDDLVGWRSISDLRTKAGCVTSGLRVVNNELPYGYVSSSYSGTVFGDGGVPFSSGGTYEWCFQEDLYSGLTISSVLSANCLTESPWTQADNITISGTPGTADTYTYTFFVRDDNDPSGNISQKRLVLTINASPGITISNGLGPGNNKRYEINGGSCTQLSFNGSVTVTTGQTIVLYNHPGICNVLACTRTFSDLDTIDADDDGDVSLTAIANGSCTISDP